MRIKIRFNKLPVIIAATLLTAFVLSLVIIAIPQAEQFLQSSRFNLNVNDKNYWKKEVILKLDIENKDLPFKDKKIAETEAIIYNRLNKLGVEEVTIESAQGESENNPLLKVTVQSSLSQEMVLPMIQQRYFMRIVTRKEGVDFNNEEDQFAIYNPANYEETPFTRRSFRNLYITKLKNTAGDETYFAIFKTLPFISGEFDKFVSANQGKLAGLRIDGFVTPITIPVATQSQSGVIRKPIFSVSLNITQQQYRMNNLLMNGGVIPVDYTVESTRDLAAQVYSINYVQLTLALTGVILVAAIYFLIRREGSQILQTILPIVILTAGWMTFLKLTQIPIDQFLLVIEFILLMMLAPLLSPDIRKKYPVIIATVGSFVLLHFLGIGYIRVFSLHMAYILVSFVAAAWFARIYINVITRTIQK